PRCRPNSHLTTHGVCHTADCGQIPMHVYPTEHGLEKIYGTTILCVRHNDEVAIAGVGQVSMGDTMFKGNARKVRRLYGDKVLACFAGSTADAFTLFERFEGKLQEHNGQLTRAAVDM